MARKLFLLFFVLGIAVSIGSAQEKVLKRKVAIGRFSNETQYSKSVFYNKDTDPMGRQASDILATRLRETGKFLLIERQDYDKIVGELNASGAISQKIGADYLIIGSITEFGRKTIGTQGFFSDSKEQIVEAAVTLRLVDVSTGVIVFSGEAKGEATTMDKKVMGMGKTADFDATLSDKALSAAISKLVEGVMNKCMDNPWKAYILGFEDGVVVMSGGRSQGIAEKDIYTVYEKGKKVVNPQTGIAIELPGKPVAKIQVTGLMGDTPESEVSLGTIIQGEIDKTNLSKYVINQTK